MLSRLFGVIGGQKKSAGTTDPFGPASVTIPGTISVGVKVTGTYLFNSLLGKQEANKPPYIEDCYISGSLVEGDSISMLHTDVKIYNGGFAGSHTYRLYQSNNVQGAGESLIYEGTNPVFALTAAQASKYLRMEVDPKQTGGLNLTGATVKSPYYGPVAGTSFNPVNDLNWNGAYVKESLVNFNTSPVWANSKGGFTSGIQDGVRPLPIYNISENALEFTRASSQILAYTKNVALGAPYEWYIRFKLKSLTGTQCLLSFNNSIYVAVTSTGALNVSGSVSAAGLISTNTWYVLRVSQNGISSVVEINFNGTEIPFTTASATASGTGTGRMGALWNNTNFLDGYLSEVFIIDTPLTTTEKFNLKNWFGL